MDNTACIYGKEYYIKHQIGSYNSAINILGYILSQLDITSMIDFGCGMGTWCLAAQELNIKKILGVDIHDYADDYMLISSEQYKKCDLRNEVKLEICADLVISVEVGEHVEENCSKQFIDNICNHGEVVLFSAAIPFQGGQGHINEQPCSYWAQLFTSNGYMLFDCIRPQFWNSSNVEIWYKNNCVMFIREDRYDAVINRFKVSSYPIDIIHPDMLKRIIKK